MRDDRARVETLPAELFHRCAHVGELQHRIVVQVEQMLLLCRLHGALRHGLVVCEGHDLVLRIVTVRRHGDVSALEELRHVGAGNDSLHEAAALASELAAELDEDALARGGSLGPGVGEGREPAERAAVVEVGMAGGAHGAEA